MEEFDSTIGKDLGGDQDPSSEDYVEDPGRREVLKGIGMLALGALLASCAPKKMLDAAEGDINMQNNVEELNKQFSERQSEFVNDKGLFDYERHINKYPGFEEFIPSIEMFAHEIKRFYDIDIGVMMALSSSILVANVGREDDKNTDVNNRRTGIMGLVPSNVLPIVNKSFEEKYSIEEMEIPKNSIYFSMLYMAETLKDIKNNGENKDLMSIILANYYGGQPLQNVAKGVTTIENNEYLRENYELYAKTLEILNGSSSSTQDIQEVEIEQGVVDTLDRAVDLWSESKFDEYRNVFFKAVNEYYKDALVFNPNISKPQLLSVFLAVARAESKGGIYKEIKNPHPDTPKELLALGWYQIVPKWKHLEKFNDEKGKNYTYKDLVNNDVASIEVGIWTLMQYSHAMDIVELMKKFKGGWAFGENLYNQPDDPLWWNRVSYGIKSLLGDNPFNMQYMNYLVPREIRDANGNIIETVWDSYKAYEFEQKGHYGVMAKDIKKKEG